MKDGKKRPYEIVPDNYYHLISQLTNLGWWAFEIPAEVDADVSDWLEDAIDYNLHSLDVFTGPFSVSIRRHEDATLFKLSWPECKPYAGIQ